MSYGLTRERTEDAIALKPVDRNGLESYHDHAQPFVRNVLDSQRFEGKHGTFALVYDRKGKPVEALVGTDDPPEDPRADLHLFAKLAPRLPADHVYVADPADWPDFPMDQAALGWGLAHYKFDRYLKKKKSPVSSELWVPEDVDLGEINAQLDAMFLARDLVNTPASDLSPQALCARARGVAEAHGAQIRIIEGKKLLAENYPAIYAVGKGSNRPPALIDLRWGDPAHPKLTLVGKGVVFDTGGLNLKNAGGMSLMKKDMGGGAVTLALAQLVMSQALPVRLRLLIPTVENGPGHDAYRPSDVIQTRKGLSVEIGNTDAEGRVILCDALAEAVTEHPDLIVDMATLTGAARVALGQDLPGFWTPSEAIGAGLQEAGTQAADPIWRMPLWRPYRQNLASQTADINNMANTSYGGSITAALYLHEFVKPFENWVHFDIYCWRTSALPGSPKGAEASALRAIYRFLRNRYRE